MAILVYYDDLNVDSLTTSESSSIKIGWWLLELTSKLALLGSIHCLECSNLKSELSKDRGVDDCTCSSSMESCTVRRQTGQVDCFLSHTSMQERWKLWPHWGIILNISLS